MQAPQTNVLLGSTLVSIVSGLFLLAFSAFQWTFGLGDYVRTAILFAVPLVVCGALFQIYPTVQKATPRFSPLTWIYFSVMLLSFGAYASGFRYKELLLGASVVFALFILLNTRKVPSGTEVFFLVGSAFYVISAFMNFRGMNPFLIFHTTAVGFLLTVVFGALYILVPMLQLRQLAFAKHLWMHLTFHTLVTVDFLMAWRLMSFEHIYVSGMFILASALIACFVIFKTLSAEGGAVKGLDPSVQAFVLALFVLIFSLTVGVMSAGRKSFDLVSLHANGLIFGFFFFLVAGAVYHIVPLLVWWKLYATKIGSEKVPSLKELFDKRILENTLLVTLVGLLGGVLSEASKPFLHWAFGLIYTGGLLYFVFHSAKLTLRFFRG